MNILLISKTAIIKQILTLISSKLNLELTVLDVNIVSSKFDIIIIEDNLFDDKFPLKDFANRLGVITKNKNHFQNICDFVLPKPFLPSLLFETIQEQIKLSKTQVPLVSFVEPIEQVEEVEQYEEISTNDLVENIASEIIEEVDESVISGAFMPDGGILDLDELSKIQDMLDDKQNKDDTALEDDEWIDLANIIDKAIDEVKDYHFNLQEPIKLILNDYSINEVSGLLNKLDQNIVDALTNGEEITLKLKVNK